VVGTNPSLHRKVTVLQAFYFAVWLEELFTTIDAFDLKLLSGFNVILTPNLSWKDDLTICRNRSSHDW
jgi:hypothetical protein